MHRNYNQGASAQTPFNPRGHRHAGHGLPGGHQPPVLVAQLQGVQSGRAIAQQPAVAAADGGRGAPAGGPHPGDPEGEGAPGLDLAHPHPRHVGRRHAVHGRGRQFGRSVLFRRQKQAKTCRPIDIHWGIEIHQRTAQTEKTIVVGYQRQDAGGLRRSHYGVRY